MKKLIYFLILNASISVYSQFINVSNSTFNNEQLVNTVLLNSACVGATNITSRTGTVNNINGIGSFTNTNPNFPMTKGVILSTGNVLNAAGPNNSVQNGGTTAWTGDANLVTALGNPAANYLNATVLEFDFTPIAPQFSFDFIFASEEYGNFQCREDFHDAFAFILTNTITNTSQNLAVLPNLNIPISVRNVRDAAFNPTCTSENASFFGNFYGGTNSGIAATNFEGETVLLTASALLTPNIKYHIKLVIADRNDELRDSAVFISGTSFNIGQDVVGPDLTVADKTAVCFGGNKTITTGLNAADYNFEWIKLPSTTILGTSNSFTITAPGIYQVSYLKNGSICAREINEIEVEFYPEIIVGAPKDIYKCEVAGNTTYNFDLTYNTPILLDGLVGLTPSDVRIDYFSDAAATSPITNATAFSSAPNTSVSVKITNILTGCSTIKQFDLKTTPPVTALSLGTITECETTAGSGNLLISLGTKDALVLGTQLPSVFNVTYYSSQADADNGAASLQIDKTSTTVANGAVIYVRVENKTDPTCFKTNFFTIAVTAKPIINDIVKNEVVCINYTLPALITPGANYYTAAGGTGTLLNAGQVITPKLLPNYPTNPVRIFIYLSNGNCFDQKFFTITKLDLDLIVPKPSLDNCDQFTIPFSDYASYYLENPRLNPSTPKLAFGTVLTTNTTIFLYYQVLGPPSCDDLKAFDIKITKTPVLPNFKNIYKCTGEFYTLPALAPVVDAAGLPIVGATINYYNGPNATLGIIPAGTQISGSTKNIYVYASAGTVPCFDEVLFTVYIGLPLPEAVFECDSYSLPALPVDGGYYTNIGGPSANNIEIPVGTLFTESKNIWVYIKSDPTDLPPSQCVFNEILKIKIILPVLPTLPNTDLDIKICEKYILPPLPIIPSNINVSPIQVFNQPFYNTSSNGSGTTLPVGSEVTSTQDIYLVFKNTKPDGTICAKSITIKIKINPLPVIALAGDIDNCVPYPLLNSQAGITFYRGPNKTGGILPLAVITNGVVSSGTVFNEDATFYAYAESNSNPPCYNEKKINLRIYLTSAPQFPNVDQCLEYVLPTIVQPNPDDNVKFYSGSRLQINGAPAGQLLPAGTIFKTNQTLLPDGTILPVINTVYVYNVKNVRFFCDAETTFNVRINPNPDVLPQPSIVTCDSYTLPIPAIGNYYTETHYPITTATGGSLILPGTVITSSQKIFVFAGNINLAGCTTDEEPLDITINKVDKLGNVVQCNDYILPSLNIDDIPKPLEGDYYTQSGGPTGSGVRLLRGTVITPTSPPVVGVPSSTTLRRFYIYMEYPSTLDASGFCSSETFFDVTIISKPTVDAIPAVIARTFCDEIDNQNDGIRVIDLKNYNTTVLGTNQIGAEFTVAYYNSQSDADTNTNPILIPTEFGNLKNIFVRVNNVLALSCFATSNFQLFVNKLPEPNSKDGVICEDNKTGLIINPYTISTGLSLSTYSFIWKDETNAVVGNDNSLSVSIAGIYSLDVTNTVTNCQMETRFIKVILSRIAIASYSLSENFNDNQFITINAVGSGGDYEYQLDEGDFQDSNIFTSAPFGDHIVTVRDKNGCGLTKVPIIVVNHPKFFTPNDDGYNDFWNVLGLENQLQANIFIYDRHGKFLKQMPTNSIGWDGKFNEQLLPATDYWFTVSYLENGIEKLFKSHFSLKR